MNHPTNGIVVMLMEDNEKEKNRFEQLLKDCGLTVRSFICISVYEAALHLPVAARPDIIFLRVTETEMAHSKAPDWLKPLRVTAPLVTLSKDVNDNFYDSSLRLGADDHLFYSELTTSVLKKTILYCIERRKHNDQLRDTIERYRLVAKATNDIAWDWEFSKKSTYWIGSGIETILKYPLTEMTVAGDFWENNIHPEDKDRVTQKLKEVFKNADASNWEDEYRFKNNEGSYNYIYDRGFIIYKNNEPVRMLGIMEDITAKVLLEKKLETEKLLKQKHITEAVIVAQEKERTEIGKELHDNVNQLLSASRLYIDAAITDQKNNAFLLSQASGFIKNAIDEIRTLSKVLHTPLISEMGLVDSVENLIEEVMAVSQLDINFKCFGFNEEELNDNFKLTLYRIIQEQLTNILKHARAQNAWITLSQNDEYVLLEIKDNGVGFDTTKKRQGIGISNINSRASMYNGSIKLDSTFKMGSTLFVRFPAGEILGHKTFDNTYR
jgi:two-component system sensor histidine kinase UhpB